MHHWVGVYPRCLNGPPLCGLALEFGCGSMMSSCYPVQVNPALQKLMSCSAMNTPRATDTSSFCEGRGATDQPQMPALPSDRTRAFT